MKKLYSLASTALLAATLVGCAGGGASYTDGTYTGEAAGYDPANPIKVEVTVTDGKMSDIQVLSHGESVDKIPATQEALDTLPGAIVEKGSTDIDGLSGATMTSNGIKGAVDNALEQATAE
ncbi:FMN-binding protein [Peptoniphilus sp. KCTC 25270]|uniref:FMN-binding protein n=1 Tax=Peptoniphilus sp. KCTC 25270 TaxID=2897414 RepID=UPI001E5C0D23|nr:FMN-binding protein [Peptoniphilus sp. KCTC 25270]MCD1146790.1 FMN-binding protein [Peptoniphilus sp. KCTC 25270]